MAASIAGTCRRRQAASDSEGVSGRIAARYLKQDAALENVGGPEDAGGVRDEYGVRGALAFDLGEGSELLLRAHMEADNGVNPAPLNSALVLGDHQISVGADGVRDTDNDFHGLSAEYTTRWGDWRITSLTAAEGFQQRYGFDFDGTPAAVANLSYDRDYLQLSQELYGRIDWEGGDALLGVSLASDDFAQDYLIWCGVLNPVTLVGTCQYPGAPGRVGPTPASTAPAVSLLTHIEQTRRMGAVYGTVDFDLGEATTLTLGGRQTFERIDGEGFGQHIYADGVRALNNRSGVGLAQGANTIDEDRFTGMAALRHRFSDDLMAYASFGQGYKSGGFNGEVANNVTHYQDEGLFSAETVDAYRGRPEGRAGRRVQLRGGGVLPGLQPSAGAHLRRLPAAGRWIDHLQLAGEPRCGDGEGRGSFGRVASAGGPGDHRRRGGARHRDRAGPMTAAPTRRRSTASRCRSRPTCRPRWA